MRPSSARGVFTKCRRCKSTGTAPPPTPTSPPPSNVKADGIVPKANAEVPAKPVHASKNNLSKDMPNLVGDTGHEITVDENKLTKKQASDMAKRDYSAQNMYTSLDSDGNNQILFKYSPPDEPTAHVEGHILDFTDGVPHALQKNPFSSLAAEARSGKIEGVNKYSLGIPGAKQKSLYAFERRNSFELTNYGRSTDYISATPAELETPDLLLFAANRLPGFDETRESLFDKAATRYYFERRDLRLLERDSILNEKGLAEYNSETALYASRELRRVVVKDAVMQSANKWLGLKFNETEEAYIRQHEDIQYTYLIKRHVTIMLILAACVVLGMRMIQTDDLRYSGFAMNGELRCVSGYTGHSDSAGGYTQIGQMYRFQDKVQQNRLLEAGTTRGEMNHGQSYRTTAAA